MRRRRSRHEIKKYQYTYVVWYYHQIENVPKDQKNFILRKCMEIIVLREIILPYVKTLIISTFVTTNHKIKNLHNTHRPHLIYHPLKKVKDDIISLKSF